MEKDYRANIIAKIDHMDQESLKQAVLIAAEHIPRSERGLFLRELALSVPLQGRSGEGTEAPEGKPGSQKEAADRNPAGNRVREKMPQEGRSPEEMLPEEVLKKYFGYDHFREGQKQLIKAILDGRDVMGIMPTGAGKSLCYQIPALLLKGITIVISPLISLMNDQVYALNQNGIRAAYINSSLNSRQIWKVLKLAEEGEYRIMYVAPERLSTPVFMEFVSKVRIPLVAVDEAHCISQWGQDFRPGYLGIHDFIDQMDERPVVAAFTATATEKVREDIRGSLCLQDPEELVTSFDRPTLYFGVEHISGLKAKIRYVKDYIRRHDGDSGIIYCATRKNVDRVCEELKESGIRAAGYHAGLASEEREYNQKRFVGDEIQIMVATNAFGMGIDKSNVRFVIHFNMPQNLESYYQEAGRAGRDGDPADCILLYSAQDTVIDRFLIEHRENEDALPEEEIQELIVKDLKKLELMENYCLTTGCLREFLLGYFGEKRKGDCTGCSSCNGVLDTVDRTGEARKILACISEEEERFGMRVVTEILTGKPSEDHEHYQLDRFRSFGNLSGRTETEIRKMLRQMISMGYLYVTEGQYPLLRIGREAEKLITGESHFLFRDDRRPFSGKSGGKKTGGAGAGSRNEQLDDSGKALFEQLRDLRNSIARRKGVPPYVIFQDRSLQDMCLKKPSNRRELLDVYGVGESKADQYGDDFLRRIADFTTESDESR